MSTPTTTPRVSYFHLSTILLVLTVLGLVAVVWYERTMVDQHEQRALNALYEERNLHARNIAAIFLRAIVEEDYQATRPLLRQVAVTSPGAAEGFGPEVKLKEQVQAWLKARTLDGKRFESFGRGGELLGGELLGGGAFPVYPEQYTQIGGLRFEDGGAINYRLTLVRTDAQTGTGSESSCWRVKDLVLWSGERDGPRPW
jgi:hypothetical protein